MKIIRLDVEVIYGIIFGIWKSINVNYIVLRKYLGLPGWDFKRFSHIKSFIY